MKAVRRETGATLLLVDGNEAERERLEELLTGDPITEHSIRSCGSAEQALRLVREDCPDAILLDLKLKEGSALELLDELASVIDLSAVPVVITTADDREFVSQEIFKRGAVDLIHKNHLSGESLCRTVRYAIQRAQTQGLRSQIARSQRLMSLGQVAASVAHEINNPAAFVLSNLSSAQGELARLRKLLLEGGGTFDAQEIIADLESLTQDNIDGIRRIAGIVGEMRQYSHPKTESVEPVDLNDVVQIAAKLLGSKLHSLAQVSFDLSELPRVNADRGRLIQVLVNLLDNAAMAVAQGEERRAIQVRSRRLDSEVEISVIDTGPGMSEATLSRVFEPFFTTKGEGQGTGLGLSLCADYVHQHRGELEIDSTLGAGTAVIVRIPFETGLSLANTPMLPSLVPAPGSTRVIVIDDEPAVLRSFQRVLSAHHQVTTFTNAREALIALEGGLQASAVVCDVNMPDLDGPGVFRELEDSLPELAERLIFCTGGTFSSTAHRILDETGLQVLSKPVEPSTLLRAVAQVAKEAE